MPPKELSVFLNENKPSEATYFYLKSKIKDNIERTLRILHDYSNVELLYAIKANSYQPILNLFADCGFGFHISTYGEYELIKKLKTKGSISHTGPYVDERLIDKENVTFNLNSIEELAKFPRAKNVGLRVNTGEGWSLIKLHAAGSNKSQFGVPYSSLVRKVLPSSIERLHMHANSDSLKPEPFLKGFRKLLKIAQNNPQIHTINIGGGIGRPSFGNEQEFDFEQFMYELNKIRKEFQQQNNRKLGIQLECGNYYVRNSGWYVCQIQNIIQTEERLIYYTNGTNAHLLGIQIGRQLLSMKRGKAYPSRVIGASCMRGDELAESISLPKLKKADYVLVKDTGAYCAVQANRFNQIPMPNEILI